MQKSIGLDTLISKRESLISEKEAMNTEFNSQISELESCIELMSGKKVWEVTSETLYDDTNTSYIKSSIEEI